MLDKRNLVNDRKIMQLALKLAEKGRGKTSPNPMVGAVVTKGGQVVGTGYHHKAGARHAEIIALKQAGCKARGAVLYVTLEPCNTQGKTPPCAPYIAACGIKKVVIAAADTNPANRNNGIKWLRRKGIQVIVGVLEKESLKMNESYNKFITTGIPFVTVKAAMSLDGKIATRTGSSKWISGKKSREFVSRLRRQVDSVLVGRRTFLKDKPKLKGVKHRIFLGRKKVKLTKLLKELGRKGIMHLLIEGGGETIASAIQEGLVDRIYVFIAPKIIGGKNAPTVVDGKGIGDIAKAIRVKNMDVRKIGSDFLVTGCLRV